MQFFLWCGRWRSVGTVLRYAIAFQDVAVVGPLPLSRVTGAGGATKVRTLLEVWVPNMYPTEAEPLPPAAFHPLVWPKDLFLTPPPPRPKTARGGVPPGSQDSQAVPALPPRLPRVAQHPPDPGGGGDMASLLSTPVTVPGPMKEGGVRMAAVDCDRPSPSGPTSDPGLSSRDDVAREGPRGFARLNARCLSRETGPLEWWAVPCVSKGARLARPW